LGRSRALQATRINAYRMVCLAAGVVVPSAAFFLIFRRLEAGYSILLGGMVWLLPNFYMAYCLFAKARPAGQIVTAFYRAEIIKLLLSALLFISVCQFLVVNVLALLGGYMIAQVAFWLTPLFENKVLKR
jgi:ATP synthase protein I